MVIRDFPTDWKNGIFIPLNNTMNMIYPIIFKISILIDSIGTNNYFDIPIYTSFAIINNLIFKLFPKFI